MFYKYFIIYNFLYTLQQDLHSASFIGWVKTFALPVGTIFVKADTLSVDWYVLWIQESQPISNVYCSYIWQPSTHLQAFFLYLNFDYREENKNWKYFGYIVERNNIYIGKFFWDAFFGICVTTNLFVSIVWFFSPLLYPE